MNKKKKGGKKRKEKERKKRKEKKKKEKLNKKKPQRAKKSCKTADIILPYTGWRTRKISFAYSLHIYIYI